ncbi:MAG: hypothetical protein JNM31_03850 [Flavobacteriales bacterium]|nr:hypothetical protein [Flavobacteriales bacterium]
MDDQRDQFRSALAEATMSPAMRRRKLLFWVFRQMVLAVLAWTFWERTWMRWLFWIGVAIALINLFMILCMPSYLRRMRRRGEAAMERLEQLREEGEREE